MVKEEEQKQIKRFFSHDENASIDPKIVEMRQYFDEHKNEFSPEFLQSLLPITALGAFWRLVEYMHVQNLPVDAVKTISFEFDRIPPEFLQMILDNFGLFRKETDENGTMIYVSDRILRNKKFVQDKSGTGNQQDAANFRWFLSYFGEEYEKIFGERPTLTKKEMKTLRTYSETIPNLKEKLPDIFYTMSLMPPFENGTKARYPWLLNDEKNNMGKIIHGEIGGGLKHKKTEAELQTEQEKAEEKKRKEKEAEESRKKAAEIQQKEFEAMNDEKSAIDYFLKYIPIATVRTGPKSIREIMGKFNLSKEKLLEAYKAAEVQDV